jgi:hypothetical protein
MAQMTNDGDEPLTESWLERARLQGAAPAEPQATPVGGSRAVTQGWDPFDVWLRHVDEPRRLARRRRNPRD